jgi:hypothetical protein
MGEFGDDMGIGDKRLNMSFVLPTILWNVVRAGVGGM